MTPTHGRPPGHDDLLDEVIVAYLEAVEQGESPHAQEWLARYPQLAKELVSFIADQEKIVRWTAPLREAAGAHSSPVTVLKGGEAPSTELSLPTETGPFGDYLLLKEISRGGMGIIYLARQVRLDRLVAVKRIIAGPLASPTEIERFRTEALAAARLDHPNIVPIYEVGQVQGQHFYSMKVMEGGSLSDHLTEWTELPRAAAALMVKVARAVHHAHQRGILHRDLKPGNVLLDAAGEPHVSDFGLAKRLEDATHSGMVVGTPSYMAPEQAAGHDRLTTAADVYSLGAILFALLTGKPPFQAPTRLETLRQVAEQMPARPQTLNARVDRDLETICLKCLDKSPEQRYAGAQALAEDLERWLADEPIHARPAPLWTRGLKWAKRRPALAALLLVSLGMVLSLVIGFLQYQERRATVAEQALNERRRADSLRTEVQGLLLQGQEAMAARQWAQAQFHLSSAHRLAAGQPLVMDLQGTIEQLLQQTDRRLDQEQIRQNAEQKYRVFMELREQALFEEMPVAGAALSTNTKAIRETIEKALCLFGVAPDNDPGLIIDESFNADQRRQVQEGCYELLLILAETVAQEDPAHLKQALQILDRAKKLGYDSKAYHLQRARYLQRMGDRSGAREESERTAARPASNALDHFLIGQELHRQGKVAEAIAACHDALRREPNHFWARYFLAVGYLRLQPPRPDLAADCLTACLGQGHEVLWVYLLRGLAYTQQGQIGAALEDFQKALKRGPNEDAKYAVFVNRGLLFDRQGKFTQAIADLRQAITVKPQQYEAYANLAKVYQQQKQFTAAVEQLDRAIQTATQMVQAGQLEKSALALLYRNRAQLQLDQSKFALALADLNHALDLDPCARDYAACGRLLQRLGKFDQALRAYEAALALDADHGDAQLGMAEVHFRLEQHKEAVQCLDCYLKRPHPADASRLQADAYRARGLAQVKLGEYAGALADFTLALSLQDDPPTHCYRGWAYLVGKAPALALADFEKAIQLDKNNADAYNGRAAARVKLGVTFSQLQEAIADAREALGRGVRNEPRILWSAARIYAQVAARLDTEQYNQALQMAAQYREQAVKLLREALDRVPATERPTFWQTYIHDDPDLARFASLVRSRPLR
jgi:tetratricopeptide (TPR) repeat protein